METPFVKLLIEATLVYDGFVLQCGQPHSKLVVPSKPQSCNILCHLNILASQRSTDMIIYLTFVVLGF